MKELIYITHRDEDGWERGNGSYINFQHQGIRRMRKIEGQLRMDYETTGDGILWVLQRIYCLTAHPTDRDRIEQRRYDDAETLEDGEIVKIRIIAYDGKSDPEELSNDQYRFHALGDYSDCGKFEKVA